ncbi:MAG: diguanylate cyclase, partial [Terracidiphilus sp.]
SGAMRMARDICAALHKRAIPHPANSAGVATVSVGCATVVPQLGRQAVTLIDCADQALYQAKRAGRNRACNYQPHVAEEANPNERLNPVAIKSA